MDKKLQLIQHLYGETDDRNALRELLQDEDLNAEYQELNEAKFWLDHTSHERPDQAVLDTIFAAASRNTAGQNTVKQHTTGQKTDVTHTRALRTDRAPVQREKKTRRRLFGPVTAVFTLAMTIGIGYFVLQTPETNLLNSPAIQSIAPQAANEPLTASKSSSLEKQEVGFADRLEKKEDLRVADRERSAEASELMQAGYISADTSLPEWNDDLDDVLRFQRRIDMLLEQNTDLAWDEAAVPLESLRSARPVNPGVLQAGSRKPNSGNQ